MNCVRCHREIPDGSKYCNHCGKKQISMPVSRKVGMKREKGSGTVTKLDGKRKRPYQVRVTEDGKQRSLGTFATWAEAINALDSYNASSLKSVSKLKYTFSDVYNMWSQTHYQSITEKGRYSYESAFKKAEQLHRRYFIDLKTSDYQQIINTLVNSGKSRSLCEKQRQLFSQLCKFAMQEDIISKNYAEFLALPPAPRPKCKIFTSQEISGIRSIAESSSRLSTTAKIAMVLLYTGMRINELLTINPEDVHLAERYMIGGEKTDAGRDRVIPIHENISKYIDEWLINNRTKYLLHTNTGKKMDANNYRKSFNSLMAELCIYDKTPHTCRHTAATYMIEAGIDPTLVKEILGHSDFATTVNNYTHNSITSKISAISYLNL